MSESTIIAWTDHTFNPWMGCAKVSAGCAHCYAETLTKNRMGLQSLGRRRATPGYQVALEARSRLAARGERRPPWRAGPG